MYKEQVKCNAMKIKRGIFDVIDVTVGPTLDLIGSYCIERSSTGTAFFYERYDRQTNDKVGQEVIIVGDGIAQIVNFTAPTSLRKSILKNLIK